MIRNNLSPSVRQIIATTCIIMFLVAGTACSNVNDANEATKTALELEIARLQLAGSRTPSTVLSQEPEIGSTSESPEQDSNEGESDDDVVDNIVIPNPAPTPFEDSLFFDDFSNNDNGWDLGSKEGGSVTITSHGLTLILPGSDNCIFAKVPDFNPPDNYSIEATLFVEGFDSGHFGFAFGGKTYGIGEDSNTYFTHIYDDGQGIRDDQSNKFWSQKTPIVMRLDVSKGNYSLFVNNEPMGTTQFTPQGNGFSFFSCRWRYTSGNQQVSFDNVRISE